MNREIITEALKNIDAEIMDSPITVEELGALRKALLQRVDFIDKLPQMDFLRVANNKGGAAMRSLTIAIALLIGTTFIGCNKKRTDYLTNPTFDGAWNGNIVSHNNQALRLDFIQGATALEGTFQITEGNVIASGTVMGTWDGNEVDFTFTQVFPCAGSHRYSAIRDGQKMSFVLNGSVGCIDYVSGHGVLFAEKPIRY